ncbi:ABC transporter permease subunit [Eubacteriales bacterium OttesenSCG-928-N13]|nr:ABC transporter permease subunit [Eubacteriales bacterium OttesenSCG-928-N13]
MAEKLKKILPQIVFVGIVIIAWQVLYRLQIWPELLFPSVGSIGRSFVDGFTQNNFGGAILYSLELLARGLLLGIALSLVLSSLAMVSKSIYAVYNMLVSVFDLIPGVALFPVAILWFGTGESTIIFIVVHSVIWPMSRNVIDGFSSIPKIYIEAGENIGLSGLNLVRSVYLPAAFPHIISGLKVGWARAWRGLMSAEMVFGATGAGAGIGFYIQYRRSFMDSAGLYASLIAIILIGVVVEYGVFRVIENRTIRKWGMVR